MAKAVRWQIPFVSTIENIPYRIDIYDEEGDWSGITELLGGPSPFVTDEDDNTDFFAPIRIQTGTIQVCTAIPGGGMLNLDDILPENNISKPVRVVRTDTQTIEWQGFLNSEAYNQDYIGTPQILNFPVNSVLEAMDSVQMVTERAMGLEKINKVIYNALNEIAIQSGLTIFTHVNCSYDSIDIFSKYIDQTVFYDRNDYNNENDTSYIISGISAKEVIERICTFMGWVAREQGTELYLTRIDADFGVYQYSLYDFNYSFVAANYIAQYVSNLIDSKWRGISHQRSIYQGAKSVEVVAGLEKYELNISLPEFPVGDTLTVYRQLWKYNEDGDWLYLLASKNLGAYSNIQFAFYSADVRYMYHHFESYQLSILSDTLAHIAVGVNSSIMSAIQGDPLGLYRFYAGSFLCRYAWETEDNIEAHDTTDALYCVFFPGSIGLGVGSESSDFDLSKVGPIFSINNVTHYTCNEGYLKLSASADTIFAVSSSDYTGRELQHTSDSTDVWKIGVELQFGTKWWNGSAWQNTHCIFNAQMTGNNFEKNWNNTMGVTETDGLLIPITEQLNGLIVLKLWPIASFTNIGSGVLEMMFSSIEIDHLTIENSNETGRSGNHYFRLLGTNFRNEISVNTALATYLNNEPSPSLIMESPNTPLRSILYNRKESVFEAQRPEIDLLNRLAKYYSKSRQTVNVQIGHPTESALSLIQLNGINDGRVYAPMAESRDWKGDVSTITCMELPNE